MVVISSDSGLWDPTQSNPSAGSSYAGHVMFSWTSSPARTGERRTVPVQVPGGGTEAALWHYRPSKSTKGADDAGPGRLGLPRLLLIHGFRGDHHGMQLIVDALPEYEIFVPDLPGFGETAPLCSPDGKPLNHSVDTFAEVVEALAAELELGPRDAVAGHSFGSIVVAAHIARSERRWAGAGLIAPISDDIFRGRLLPGAAGVELYYRLCAVLPAGWGDRALRSRIALGVMNLSMIVTDDPGLTAFIRDQHGRYFGRYADRRTLLEAYRASSRHTVAEYASSLNLPVLLLSGAQDQISTRRGRLALRDAVTGPRTGDARMEVIRGSGHLLHYEKPAQVGRALRRFLQEL